MSKSKISNVLIIENNKGGIYIVDNQKDASPPKKIPKNSSKNRNEW